MFSLACVAEAGGWWRIGFDGTCGCSRSAPSMARAEWTCKTGSGARSQALATQSSIWQQRGRRARRPSLWGAQTEHGPHHRGQSRPGGRQQVTLLHARPATQAGPPRRARLTDRGNGPLHPLRPPVVVALPEGPCHPGGMLMEGDGRRGAALVGPPAAARLAALREVGAIPLRRHSPEQGRRVVACVRDDRPARPAPAGWRPRLLLGRRVLLRLRRLRVALETFLSLRFRSSRRASSAVGACPPTSTAKRVTTSASSCVIPSGDWPLWRRSIDIGSPLCDGRIVSRTRIQCGIDQRAIRASPKRLRPPCTSCILSRESSGNDASGHPLLDLGSKS
jgi:hypothetical protein